MATTYLSRQFTAENALQAMNAKADKIESDTGIAVIRCHLGNPLGPYPQETFEDTAKYFRDLAKKSLGRGYENVAGNDWVLTLAANALRRIDRMPDDSITRDNIRGVVAGTGGLNVAMRALNHPVVLAPEPFYPPWKEIANSCGSKMMTYPLQEADDYLPRLDLMERAIAKAEKAARGRPVLLLYHYPSNPTGKTLTQAEAEEVGRTLNQLCKNHPALHLAQEDIYLGTTASDMGLYSPLPHLDEEARARTMLLVSTSKLGHAPDRGGFIVAWDKDLLEKLRNVISISTLGASHPSLRTSTATLLEIAKGGVGAKGEPGTDPNNFRYKLADYYQARLRIAAEGIQKMETTLGEKILPRGTPKGAYYLYPNLDFLRHKPIPAELKGVFGQKETFENADDVAKALANAHLMGLQPVIVASGKLFASDPADMHVRIATVEEDKHKMCCMVNTLCGLAEKATGKKMGGEFFTRKELLQGWPANGRQDGHTTRLKANRIASELIAGNTIYPGFVLGPGSGQAR